MCCLRNIKDVVVRTLLHPRTPPPPQSYIVHVRSPRKSQRLHVCRNTCHHKHISYLSWAKFFVLKVYWNHHESELWFRWNLRLSREDHKPLHAAMCTIQPASQRSSQITSQQHPIEPSSKQVWEKGKQRQGLPGKEHKENIWWFGPNLKKPSWEVRSFYFWLRQSHPVARGRSW